MANSCPACGKKYSLPAGAVGRAFVCKRCGLKLIIHEDGLAIPSVPDQGPPIAPPQPLREPMPVPLEAVPAGTAEPERHPLPRPVANVPIPAYFPPTLPKSPTRANTAESSAIFEITEDDVADEEEPSQPVVVPQRSQRTLYEFATLRWLIAPSLMVFVFWTGTGMLVLAGVSTVIYSLNAPKGISMSGGGLPTGGGDLSGLGMGGLGDGGLSLPGIKQERGFSFTWFVLGILLMTVAPILFRVFCEIMIVVFRMHETLRELNRHLGRMR